MSITVQLDLPDALAEEAEAKGLLRSDAVARLLEQELTRRRACDDFGALLKQLHSVTGDAMTEAEVQAEIDAVKAERGARRESGR